MHADHMSPSINRELLEANEEAARKGESIPYVVAPDQLTGVAVTEANDRIVTTDTNGRIKMFNIGRINFHEMSKAEIDSKISNPWFINAHRLLINSVEIVEQKDEDIESEESGEEIELPEGLEKEERKEWQDIFILTASQDQDILIHRLSNGVKIGQFAQEQPWNIFDMTPYEGIRPRYVREWLKQKKQKWLKLIDDRIADHRARGLLVEEESKIPPVRLSTKD